ncbi:Arm DNA-binding domain-containing protein [Methylorubrum populi]
MANVPKLTVGRVGALAPEAKDYVLYEEATPGFGVRVYPSGQRRYVFRYRAGGSRAAPTRMFTIGDARKVGIDDARRVARELAGRVARGEDPSEAKRQAETARARSRRFGEVRDQFLKVRRCPVKTQHRCRIPEGS